MQVGKGLMINVSPGQNVHVVCRSEFTNLRAIQYHSKRKLSCKTDHGQKTRRSDQFKFTYKENCILYGNPDEYGGKTIKLVYKLEQ